MSAWQNDMPRAADDIEPTRVVMVRMPASLHKRLKSDAHKEEISMNHLCLRRLDVPSDSKPTAA